MTSVKRFPAFSFAAALAVAALASMTVANTAEAKGGATFVYVPGQCNSDSGVSTAVLIKSQNAWQFGVQVTGVGAGDTWVISWLRNGVPSYTSTATFPSGWLNIGMTTMPSERGSNVSFSAVATSQSGLVCTVQGTVKA
ncbi:MAG: hypothetical protein ABL934_01340 [Lysobacteraceae bacterium]